MSELLTPFLRVSENVARNPVAQAVERSRLVSEVRNFQISLYYLADGDEAQGPIQTAARVLAVAIRCRQIDHDDDDTASRVMRGAMSALVARAERGFTWRTADAISIDMGLSKALEVLGKTSPKTKREAWLYVERIEHMERAA